MTGDSSQLSQRCCIRCGYRLEGLASPRCPECGSAFDFSDPRSYRLRTPRRAGARRLLPLLGFAAALLPVELLCVHFAWLSVGEVAAGVYLSAVILGNLGVLVGAALRSRRSATALLILLVALTCPRPIWLRIRLALLEAEARLIIAHLESVRVRAGGYPANLGGYRFGAAWKAGHFSYSPGAQYRLSWWAADPGVAHWYTPGGGPGFYPD